MKSKTPRSTKPQSAKSSSSAVRKSRVKQAAASILLAAKPDSEDVQLVPLAKAFPKSVSGQVVEEQSGLGLAGASVNWTLRDASTRSNARQVELGSAVTDVDGRFFIDA